MTSLLAARCITRTSSSSTMIMLRSITRQTSSSSKSSTPTPNSMPMPPSIPNGKDAALRPSERMVIRTLVRTPPAPLSFYLRAFSVAVVVGAGLELLMCKSGFYEYEARKMREKAADEAAIREQLDREIPVASSSTT